ncbi:dynactin subunit 2 [Planococcus citri]|uniref:dynactin subunit 2 n=1 Tax=Planococcus citri TaxID=170843 RepID=UPI0031F97645
MADPKYANLYGIAHDQPDVYETSDLPEVDQITDIFEEKSEAIERLSISGPDAFNLFKGKEADATTVDFSRVRKSRIGSYNIRSHDWELAAADEEETQLQKYNRLKLEVENLIAEISSFSQNKEKDLTELSDNLQISTNSAQDLLSKIADLKLIEKTGKGSSTSDSTSEGTQFMKLTNHLNGLREKLENKEIPEKELNEVNACVENTAQFLLKLKPNQRTMLIARSTELERKISKLESLIGSGVSSTVRLCNVNVDDGLLNCCQWMVAKLSLLDSTQLDAMECRVGNINSRLEQILSNLNSAAQDTDKDKKINELYELSTKVKEKSELVQNAVERMTALESLHQQGKFTLQTISHLEKLQTELAQNLANNETTLNNIKQSMAANTETINNNIESLKKRIEDLKKPKK